MGSTRKFNGPRSRSTSSTQNGEGAKVLPFDPARRTTRRPIAAALPPKRPDKPVLPASIFSRAVLKVFAFLFGNSRGGRFPSRGTERSGKRRA
jgi:hypothetical protein